MRQDFIFSHGVYLLLGAVVLSYVIVPSAYTKASQMLFSALYRYHAPVVTELPAADGFTFADGTVPLHTIARPAADAVRQHGGDAAYGRGGGCRIVGRAVCVRRFRRTGGVRG